MKRAVQITADGSQTIAIEEMHVTYHSKHGAIQESLHVFIEAGLHYCAGRSLNEISIFEMGFGTGLNALLTLLHAGQQNLGIYYYAVEKFPLQSEEWEKLNYGERLNMEEAFKQLHQAPWDTGVQIDPAFVLHKSQVSLLEVDLAEKFDLIYFDAFAPSAQPGLWTEDVFRKMYAILKPGGVLVTYCSKGDVRRAMLTAGFLVEKIPGPPGKREMLRAIKN